MSDDEDERAARERIGPAFHVPDASSADTSSADTSSADASSADTSLVMSLADMLSASTPVAGSEGETPELADAHLRVFRMAAAMTGLAVENSHLVQRVAAEIAAREQHKRELEIAREVQRRLFPQHHPFVEGLAYAGVCRPALEVGGDYYDFITISAREFGIAIGDVSGKGIPASLLMATLRAYLRGRAAGREPHLPSLMTNLNRFVYESSPENRYATFFYAQYDASTRLLTYVNGGHNPPLLFTASSAPVPAHESAPHAPPDAHPVGFSPREDEPVRLQTGGPPVGLLAECGYEQGQIDFRPGDLLVAFTDGISEAVNGADEEWGEARLIGAVGDRRDAPVETILTHILASVDAFVAGAPQRDDMTLVILRAV